MVNGSVTHFEAIDKDGSTLKIDATSDQIEVVMQTIDEFLAVNPITVTEEGGSRVIENFDNVASVLSATPDQDWNNLGTRLKISYFHGIHRLDGGRCGDDVGIGPASRCNTRCDRWVRRSMLLDSVYYADTVAK
jgi:hypothetical protein